MLKKSLWAVSLLAFLVGCDEGGSTHNGDKGPSNSGVSRTSFSADSALGTSGYSRSQSVEIESVASITTNGLVMDIALSEDENVAYLASGEGGIEIIDISDPEAPSLVKSYDFKEYISFVEVKDGRLYAADMYQRQAPYFKLYAFNTYDPYRPSYIGYDNAQYGVGHSRVKRGDYLFEVGQGGLQIHRAYNSVYYPVGSYDIPNTSYAVAVSGNYIFVANGHDGLRIFRADNIGGREGRVHTN